MKLPVLGILILGIAVIGEEMTMKNESPYGPLNAAETRIIVDRGTERPFSGRYNETFTTGLYACRRCGAPLYRSDDKFASSCGWPAFDDEIPGAIKRLPDEDGMRTEIRCAHCDAHLGHVFTGEGLTAKDTRHCVNSASLVFEPQITGRLRRAVFAGGCFWGVEELFRSAPGVIAASSGYSGGQGDNPTYREVSSGKTGYAEAVEIVYDPALTDYAALTKFFLEIHDPTEKNRQGPDVGTQYRSAIFYFDETQEKTAAELLDRLRDKGYNVVTTLEPFRRFWNAEEYHQDYYQRKGALPYCHGYVKRF